MLTLSPFCFIIMDLEGTTTQSSGTSLTTTAPAPICTLSPIWTFPKTTACAYTPTLSPKIGSKAFLLQIVTFCPTIQF